MELQTISQVSKRFDISTRMLRYYEQIGLIESTRREEYSYRVYDESNINKLRQIIILRKLRVPVKQIGEILSSMDAVVAIEVFEKNISELNDEISALSVIRSILSTFVEELKRKTDIILSLDAVNDKTVLSMMNSLALSKNYIREEKSMDDLVMADRKLAELKDVRIIYLPPMTVAASHYVGHDSEGNASRPLNKFVLESGLLQTKPDARHFGFNNSLEHAGIGEPSPGYEMWVSIPEDMEVPAPLVKKKFHGGQYAAHVIKMGDFDHWLNLREWVNESEQYQNDLVSIRCTPYIEGMDTCLEEQLNYFYNVQNPDFDNKTMQLDLLFPVKPVESSEEISFEIEGSEAICGFKACLVTKNKSRIMGFTKIITPDMGDDAVQDYWKEAQADGRLDTLQKHKKPGAPILGFSSYDSECRKLGGWRYTICLLDFDITDVKAFKMYSPFIKKIDASKWVCFEMTKERFMGEFWEINPHTTISKLGYCFNGPISGHFDVLPEGNTRILDQSSKADKESTVYFWMPVN